jgi:hypothetical protein
MYQRARYLSRAIPRCKYSIPGTRRNHASSVPIPPLTEVTRLPNQLRVATKATPGHFASVGVYIDAGSRYETPLFAGVSHILDRMAFKVSFLFLIIGFKTYWFVEPLPSVLSIVVWLRKLEPHVGQSTGEEAHIALLSSFINLSRGLIAHSFRLPRTVHLYKCPRISTRSVVKYTPPVRERA